MVAVNQLLASSKKVFKDCVKSNGAIVAANSKKKDYPNHAKNYHFVWPRDGAFISYAAQYLDLNIQEDFFRWCTKAEDWEKTGLFYEKYKTNGKKVGENFQPDQTGAILWAASVYYTNHEVKDKQTLENLIQGCANGLCQIWKNDTFTIVSQDLWEERHCFPDLHDVFIYSLAACAKGIILAQRIFPNEKWRSTAHEMMDVLEEVELNRFYRTHGYIMDKRIDASLMGLAWPFDTIGAANPKTERTVQNIQKRLTKRKGIYRYEHDEYDGWMYSKTLHRKKGAGYWPLLNFWMSIVLAQYGNEKEALEYFDKVLSDLQEPLIPEQIFSNPYQVAVKPLAWSHAMFVIACKKLGFIDSAIP